MACLWGLVGFILEVLGRSWTHLGPSWAWSRQVNQGQVKLGQVKSGQDGLGQPPRSENLARSGQGGVAPSYKDGSALENPSSSCMVISNKNENFNYFSKFYAWFCGGRVDLKDLGLYGCFGGLGCEFERDLKVSWVHFWWF